MLSIIDTFKYRKSSLVGSFNSFLQGSQIDIVNLVHSFDVKTLLLKDGVLFPHKKEEEDMKKKT